MCLRCLLVHDVCLFAVFCLLVCGLLFVMVGRVVCCVCIVGLLCVCLLCVRVLCLFALCVVFDMCFLQCFVCKCVVC